MKNPRKSSLTWRCRKRKKGVYLPPTNPSTLHTQNLERKQEKKRTHQETPRKSRNLEHGESRNLARNKEVRAGLQWIWSWERGERGAGEEEEKIWERVEESA